MQGRTTAAIEWAFLEHAARSTFFPRPSEILELLSEKAQADYLDLQDREWQKTKAEMARAREAYTAFVATPEGQKWIKEKTDWCKRIDSQIAARADSQKRHFKASFLPAFSLVEERKILEKFGATFKLAAE